MHQKTLHFSPSSGFNPSPSYNFRVRWPVFQSYIVLLLFSGAIFNSSGIPRRKLREIKLNENEEQGCIAKSTFQRRKKPRHYHFYFSLQVSPSTIQPAAKQSCSYFTASVVFFSVTPLQFSNLLGIYSILHSSHSVAVFELLSGNFRVYKPD